MNERTVLSFTTIHTCKHRQKKVLQRCRSTPRQKWPMLAEYETDQNDIAPCYKTDEIFDNPGTCRFFCYFRVFTVGPLNLTDVAKFRQIAADKRCVQFSVSESLRFSNSTCHNHIESHSPSREVWCTTQTVEPLL